MHNSGIKGLTILIEEKIRKDGWRRGMIGHSKLVKLIPTNSRGPFLLGWQFKFLANCFCFLPDKSF
jgi:hypothetical protein